MNSERRVSQVFVELADTLVAGFDAVDFLHTLTERSIELLEADAAGVILGDERGQLRVVASTSHQAHLLELFELQSAAGPSLDCFTSGHPVANMDLSSAQSLWPEFSGAALRAGFRSTHALPLRLRDRVIGAMNLFCADRTILTSDDLELGQALADVATIGLLQERAVRESELVAEQLQAALHSRVVIEQAKGIVSARAGVDVDEAFKIMRTASRRTQRPLKEVAGALIDGSMTLDDLRTS
jgi:GAF domain-containing protein